MDFNYDINYFNNNKFNIINKTINTKKLNYYKYFFKENKINDIITIFIDCYGIIYWIVNKKLLCKTKINNFKSTTYYFFIAFDKSIDFQVY